ncbi:DUF1592 domain-containing protein [Roseimaritima sediminicola]|uniref:DUF1592 domain-containing protein n=1 Tax=Roseimaritima sediminicola TaxID=2662066 RepID=UPI00138695C1|nr:DUF1592 domain-containing protein [Roseimaritima sediminicola]
MRTSFWCWYSSAATFCLLLSLVASPVSLAANPRAEARSAGAADSVPAGLQLLYDFRTASGPVIANGAPNGEKLDLKAARPRDVRSGDAAWQLQAPTQIRSTAPPRAFVRAVKKSGELTIEAWLRTARLDQTGPARIVTLSGDTSNRNLTLGQDGKRFDVRMRTSKTGRNGVPSLSSPDGTVRRDWTHVLYTHDRGGRSRMYLDGVQVASADVGRTLAGWDESYHLMIGDEAGGGRAWQGAIRFLALYNRALPPDEVAGRFQAGPDLPSPEQQTENRSLQAFDRTVARVLAKNCLECHDPANRQGGLDLSQQIAAATGGDSGPAIVPGKPEESSVWLAVESDDMPHERPPLSPDDKQALKQWIASGAQWSIDVIDPALYLHDGRTDQLWVQRLTVDEYIRTVADSVGVDIAREATAMLPPDLRADGFANTAYNLNVDLKHVEAYATLAQQIVAKMDVDAFAKRFTNSRKLIDDNMRKLSEDMGRWVLRGPLEPHEVDLYRGISTTVASSGGDFTEAVRFMLEAMLQSPRFIYRIEHQPAEGSWTVSDHELAVRISYILWGGPPDEKLFRAARDGKLNPEQVAAHVDRMLKDPRAAQRAEQFATQWLNLNRLGNLQPSAARFPNWDPGLAQDMREETLALFHRVAWQEDRPLAELLNAQETYVTGALAEHYRLQGRREKIEPPPGAAQDRQWYRVDLSDDPTRGGLLTHGSVLTVGGDEASMVSRGLFLLHDLLRGVVNDPPPCVDTTPVPTQKGLTQRKIAMQRVANTACGGCHKRFEPLAYGLERYDGLGTFHTEDEHGNPLREDGAVQIPGSGQPQAYETTQQLAQLLAASDRVQDTLCWKLAQFAVGRPLTAADAPVMQQVCESSQAAGGSYRDVIRAIVLSDLVRKTRP